MAIPTPHDPRFRADHVGSLWQRYSRVLPAGHPDFVHGVRPDKRFVPENEAVVSELVSAKLPELESKDLATHRIEAAHRLTVEEPFAQLGPVVEVANEVWSHKSEFSPAARSAASVSN